jgi:hypothetical protein
MIQKDYRSEDAGGGNYINPKSVLGKALARASTNKIVIVPREEYIANKNLLSKPPMKNVRIRKVDSDSTQIEFLASMKAYRFIVQIFPKRKKAVVKAAA